MRRKNPESDFWHLANHTAKEVRGWPDWKRGNVLKPTEQLTVEEIKAILRREQVAESTGVLTPDKEKMLLCAQLLELLGETE